jgi:hypothetical protein
MFFIIKRSKLVLDCFTDREDVHEFSPISPAVNFYPEWWKSMESEYLPKNSHPPIKQSTIKRCSGLIEYYKKGVVMPLWTDIGIEILGSHTHFASADRVTNITMHDNEQWTAMLNQEEQNIKHFKLPTPWKFKTKENISWIYQKPYWNYAPFSNISVPSGVMEFKNQHSTHYNFFINTEKNTTIILKFGTPLAHIIPLTEKKITIKHHLIDSGKFEKMGNETLFFKDNYKNIIKLKNKCPFGFGK